MGPVRAIGLGFHAKLSKGSPEAVSRPLVLTTG